jgi:DNA topoisomerase-1
LSKSAAAGKSLVIVESPAKAKTINKFLGRKFSVKASMGHVRDLPKKTLGVDEKKGFKPTYEVLPGRKKVLDDLKKEAKGAEAIYLAPDPDREGEAICWHLSEELKKVNKKLYRVAFNEITKRAVLYGIEHPEKIDLNKVDAQQARRILDRLVGYKISPLLWDKVRRGLSAGRVQSVALRIIVEREREIKAFTPEEYWSLTATLEGDQPPAFDAKLLRIGEEKAELKEGAVTHRIADAVRAADWVVAEVESKEKKRTSPPPFSTSKLQQEAARKLGFTVKKTMTIAQHLYEGVDLGEEGAVGLITYMRTDSTRVAPEALAQVREYIERVHGKDFLPDEPRYFKVGRMSQGAHEAIRPTALENAPDRVEKFLGRDEFRLYQLIWNRFVASQMNPAVFDVTTADITAAGNTFRANGQVLRFPGYFAVYQDPTPEQSVLARTEAPESDDDRRLPPLERGQTLKLLNLDPKQHFTQPPPRFTEAGLVKELEEDGIGRPSTYATILATLQNREYALKEEGKFVPTELGMLVTDLLVEHFGDLVNVTYTARMEEELDEIEDGKMKWQDAMEEFYGKFSKDLKRASRQMRNVKREETPTEEVCGKCGKPMVIKWGRYGRFLACSGYPECKNTQELAANGSGAEGGAGGEEPVPEVKATCDKCGSPMVLRKGRFGQFLACSTYPECKNTKKIHVDKEGNITRKPDRILEEKCPTCGKNLAVKDGRFGEFTACSSYPTCRYIKLKEVGVGCPKCGGQIVERKSRRGKTFFGCNRYPECDFVTWYRPLAEKCPNCGKPYLLEKITKRDGVTHFCDAEGCRYKIAVNS